MAPSGRAGRPRDLDEIAIPMRSRRGKQLGLRRLRWDAAVSIGIDELVEIVLLRGRSSPRDELEGEQRQREVQTSALGPHHSEARLGGGYSADIEQAARISGNSGSALDIRNALNDDPRRAPIRS
jgi:hypothetical protein